MPCLSGKEIINRIKEQRISLGLSYGKLAAKTGISKSTLQRYETGYIKNLSLENFLIIAESLEVSPAYLIGLETPESIIQYLLKQPLISDFGGYNVDKLSEDDLAKFTKDMLGQLEMVSYRYRG
jgi:transcriptional regulator with XRE-family HTH domain